MKRRIFMILLVIISAVCLVFGLTACDSCNSCSTSDNGQTTNPENPDTDTSDPSDTTDEPETTDEGYSVSGTVLTLLKDYTLTEEDITYIESEGICTFNLGYYTLDLNGYTLEISSETDIAIAFNSGTITNGSLDISVPNGDISFDKVTIAESVTYSLEAAPSTIIISNATLSGSCTVVSSSNVVVKYSSVSDITLEGDGTLVAARNAELGSVTVGENASGAQVKVSGEATVSSISLNSSATVEVSGTVSEISVSESVANDADSPSITVNDGASVDSIALDAAATVEVGGSVSSVSVSETAASDTSSDLTISVTYSATVSSISLDSAADVTIAGEVTSVSVSESVSADETSISVTSAATVSQITLNSAAEVSVSGTVTSVVVNDTAEGASIKLNDSATVQTVAVAAEGTTVTVSEENTGNVKVVVSESVADSVTANVETETVTDEALATIIEELHEHAYVVSSRTSATCTETGSITYMCAECDETMTETIEALGHMYVYDNVTDSDGTTVRRGTCVRCGYTEDFEAESVSIFVSGVEELVSLIPDGTYTLSSEDGLSITEDGATLTFKDIELIITIEDSYIYGTLSLTMVEAYDGRAAEIGITGTINGNAICFSYDYSYNNGNYISTDAGYGYMSLATLLKGAIISMFNINFDIDSALTDISDILADSDATALLEDVIAAIADFAFETGTDSDGNTIYTFDADALYEALKEYGEKTPSAVIDEIFGSGAYSALKELASGLADMEVEGLADTLIAAVENLGMSKEALFVMVENFLYYGTGEEIDLDEMITYYAEYTVAEAMAKITNGDAEYIKAAIERYAAMIFGTDATDESQAVAGLMDMTISELFDSGIFPVDFTYEQMLEAIAQYKDGAQFSLTFDGEGSLVAASLCYTLGDTPVVAVTWNKGELIPTVDIDLTEIAQMAIEAAETNDGIELTIDYAGATFEITIAGADDGYDIDVKIYSDEVSLGHFHADIATAESGAEISIEGNMNLIGHSSSDGSDEDIDYGTTISGSFTVAKNDEATPDEDITAALEDTFTLADTEELTFVVYSSTYWYDTATITHGEDEEGEYYILTYTNTYASTTSGEGYMRTYVYTMRIDFVDGLPDWLLTYTDDCGDWLGITVQAIGLIDVTYTYTYGIIERNDDGSFSMTKQNSDYADERSYSEYSALGFSGYYNPTTGETAYGSQHDYQVSAISPISSNTSGLCEDGLLITYTCDNCGGSYTRTYYGHFYDYEYTYYYTIDDSYSYNYVGTCQYCLETYSYTNFYEYRHDLTRDDTYTLYVEDGHVYIAVDDYIDDEYVDSIEDETYIAMLEAYGIDTTGFYYGYVNVYHCSTCGLKQYYYRIYTYSGTEGDVCVYHDIMLLDYSGNDDYDAFTFVYYDYSYEGHASYFISGSVANANEEYVRIATEAISEILPFAEDIGELNGYTEYSCLECGEVTQVNLVYWSEDTEAEAYAEAYAETHVYLYYSSGELTRIYLTFYGEDAEASTYTDMYAYLYYDGGELTSWYLNAYTSDSSVFENYYAEFDFDGIEIPEDQTFASAQITISSGDYTYFRINFTGADATFKLNIYLYYYEDGSYSGTAYSYKYHDDCTVDTITYKYSDGKWTVDATDSYEDHSYTVTFDGKNCAEDGKFYECTKCGYTYTYYSHSYSGYSGESYTEYYIVYYENYCYDCGTFFNVTVVLIDDWTLDDDMYLVAEGQVALNLNGYTLDLNGYTYIIYGYNGSDITITDGEYSEDIVGITDSSWSGAESEDEEQITYGDGLFAVFTNDGTIIFGSVNIGEGTEIFASDEDNRSTIFQTVYYETGKSIEQFSDLL